jgi:hypothetical protein
MSYGDAQGGFIAFGLCFILIGLMVKKIGTKWIDVLFPPAAMGSIVAIIGLELAPLALNMSGFMDPVKGMTNAQAMIIFHGDPDHHHPGQRGGQGFHRHHPHPDRGGQRLRAQLFMGVVTSPLWPARPGSRSPRSINRNSIFRPS